MTGPAAGKLELKKAKVYLQSKDKKILLEDPTVYVHLKGYALARVTHLDVEHDLLDNIVSPKRGYFLSIHGINGGIEIKVEKEIKHENKTIAVIGVEIRHRNLNKVLEPGEKTRTWVGGKFGGIYIGFRKEHVERLEKLAREKFKAEPL
jgi:hypothetical protein